MLPPKMARRRVGPTGPAGRSQLLRHPALVTLATCQAPGQVLTLLSRPQPGQRVHPEATTAAQWLMTGHRVAHGAPVRFDLEAVISSAVIRSANPGNPSGTSGWPVIPGHRFPATPLEQEVAL